MPWLEVWIEEAEMIAKKLPDKNSSLFIIIINRKSLLKKKRFINKRTFYKANEK